MPIFEFKCDHCGHCFEKLCLSEDDRRKNDCPQCGSAETKKLMSCASFMGGAKSGLCGSGATTGFS